MPDVPHVSATQIELFDMRTGCPRKWGFKYIARLETPKHPGALLGTEVQDEQLDPYLLTGRPFDFTKPKSAEIALELSRLLPAPMTPGVQLRRKFSMPSPTGKFVYVGEFDLYATTSSVLPVGMIPDPGRALLLDVKTTGNLDYAKTDEDLKKDTQCQLYSMATMFEENVYELDAVWAYGRTRKPYRAQRTHLRVVASHVAEQFGRIDEIAQSLVTTRLSNPKVDDLPPNPRMCDAYGGCPYRHKCNLSPATHASAINQEAIALNNVPPATTNFLDQFRQGAPPAAVAPAAPAPVFGGAMPVVHAAGGEANLPALPPGWQYERQANGSLVPVVDVPAPQFVVSTPAAAAAAGLPAFLQQPAGAPALPPRAAPMSALAPVASQALAVAAAQAAPVYPPINNLPSVQPETTVSVTTQFVPINPPESALPPAPPVGVAAATPETKKRGRPAGSSGTPVAEALAGHPPIGDLGNIVALMRKLGIKELNLGPGGTVYGVELFAAGAS